MGSEPYVGWNWLKLNLALSKDSQLILLTRKQHEAPIRAELHRMGIQVPEFVFFDLPLFGEMNHRHRLMKLYYIFWQFFALFIVVPLQFTKRRVSIIQHCTYNVVDMPGFLWAAPKSKFVWGPIGGGQVPPKWSLSLYGTSRWKQHLRSFIKSTLRYNPLILLACHFSSKILVANDDTLFRLPSFAKRKVIKCLETAIDKPNFVQSDSGREILSGSSDKNHFLNIAWVGQLEARKGFPIILGALAKLRETAPDLFKLIKLDVVGSGPLEQSYRHQVDVLKLTDTISFLGVLKHSSINDVYAKASVFTFTSIQDTSGNVLLEAMAQGVPCIALNHHGASEILSKGGGILVTANSMQEAITGFSEGIQRILFDQRFRDLLSKDAIDSISKNHLWENRKTVLIDIYDEIL
jgi:glycosyltransferase involved in cell wall biosynthesis